MGSAVSLKSLSNITEMTRNLNCGESPWVDKNMISKKELFDLFNIDSERKQTVTESNILVERT